jgi:hypothetical protein
MPAGEDALDLIDPEKHPIEESNRGLIRAITEQGDLVAVMKYIEEDNEWQPKKVFFQS